MTGATEQATTTNEALEAIGVKKAAPYSITLFESICSEHGGREHLSAAHLELVLMQVKLYGDARNATDPLTRIRAMEAIERGRSMLPAAPKPEASYLDVTLLDDGELETLLQLTSKATVAGEGPSADEQEQARVAELKALRDEVVEARRLRAQLVEVERERDGFRLEAVRLGGELHRLKREVEAAAAKVPRGVVEVLPPNHTLGALVPVNRKAAGASGPRPGVEQAPDRQHAQATTPRRPGGVPADSELPPDCRPLLAPNQSAADFLVIGGARGSQFDNRT
jgi:hypothetical protein